MVTVRYEDILKKQVDWDLIEKDLVSLINHLNAHLQWFDEESRSNTPKRILRFFQELSENSSEDWNFTTFPAPIQQSNNLILEKDIRTYSLCEHHLLPCLYNISIGYMPDKEICGLSKLSRVATLYSSRPTIQEHVTQKICDHVYKELHPLFVSCYIEGKHYCLIMRGVRQQDTTFITSSMKWDESQITIAEANRIKEEFMMEVRKK